MIKAGDDLYVVEGKVRRCVVCSRSFSTFNGHDRATHGRVHVTSGQAIEQLRNVEGESRQRYEYSLTEAGAAAANKKLAAVAS